MGPKQVGRRLIGDSPVCVSAEPDTRTTLPRVLRAEGKSAGEVASGPRVSKAQV
jgi:hypothetical protein